MRPLSRPEQIGLAFAAAALLSASIWLQPDERSGALAHRQVADSGSQWGLGGQWQRTQLASKPPAGAAAQTE